MLTRWRKRRHCPHADLRGIYGDEIIHRHGYRLECRECGSLIDGPVALATSHPTPDDAEGAL